MKLHVLMDRKRESTISTATSTPNVTIILTFHFFIKISSFCVATAGGNSLAWQRMRDSTAERRLLRPAATSHLPALDALTLL